LIQPLVFHFLIADTLADRRLASPHAQNKIAARPEMLSYEILPVLALDPNQISRALALDQSHPFRHRILRRNRKQHRKAVGHQMPFQNATFFLRCQTAECVAQMGV